MKLFRYAGERAIERNVTHWAYVCAETLAEAAALVPKAESLELVPGAVVVPGPTVGNDMGPRLTNSLKREVELQGRCTEAKQDAAKGKALVRAYQEHGGGPNWFRNMAELRAWAGGGGDDT
jgi:hypothetical protein